MPTEGFQNSLAPYRNPTATLPNSSANMLSRSSSFTMGGMLTGKGLGVNVQGGARSVASSSNFTSALPPSSIILATDS